MSSNATTATDLLDVEDNHLEVSSSLLVFDQPLPDLILDTKTPFLHSIRFCQRSFIGVMSETY